MVSRAVGVRTDREHPPPSESKHFGRMINRPIEMPIKVCMEGTQSSPHTSSTNSAFVQHVLITDSNLPVLSPRIHTTP